MSNSLKTQHFWGTEWRNEQGQRHREDGPAIIGDNGYKAWYNNGKRQRLDNLAREWSDGRGEWWVNDYRVYIY
jgi:hypothetical protein